MIFTINKALSSWSTYAQEIKFTRADSGKPVNALGVDVLGEGIWKGVGVVGGGGQGGELGEKSDRGVCSAWGWWVLWKNGGDLILTLLLVLMLVLLLFGCFERGYAYVKGRK